MKVNAEERYDRLCRIELLEEQLAERKRVMSHYRGFNRRVTKIEQGLATVQQTRSASQHNILQDLMTEGDRILHPCMWDWVLESTEPFKQQDQTSKIASFLAAGHGWELYGGWREAPRYWWALKGCTLTFNKLNTDGLFYFFRCSRAEFDALPEQIRDEAWAGAVNRLTTVLRKSEACTFNRHIPEEARLLVTALSECNLSRLLKPYLPSQAKCMKGSKEALEAWIVAEHARQLAKRGIPQ